MVDEATRIEAAINTAGEYLLAGDPPETAFADAAQEQNLRSELVAKRFKLRFGDPRKWVAEAPEREALVAAAIAANTHSNNQRRMKLLAIKLTTNLIPVKEIAPLLAAITEETNAHSLWKERAPAERAVIPKEQAEKFAKLRSEVVKRIDALLDAHTGPG